MQYLIAALLAAATVSASYPALVQVYRTAHAQLLEIEAHRDRATEQLARLQWKADGNYGEPTIEQLIQAGYIAETYRDKPTVGAPIELPEQLPEAQQ